MKREWISMYYGGTMWSMYEGRAYELAANRGWKGQYDNLHILDSYRTKRDRSVDLSAI